MDEYIERAKALDKFIEGDGDDEFTEGYNFAVNEYREKIKAMPAADVQPVIVIHSRWIPTGDGTYNAYCENCGQERGSKSWNKNDFKYCFGCGARMDLDSVTHDRCSNYMDCDGSCFIDDTPCDCNGNIEKCQGR